jgi:type 1 glutamine amidotransferase
MLRSVLAILAAFPILLPLASANALAQQNSDQEPLQVLLIDGQNNHQWQQTTPVIKQTLQGTGLFEVTVATTPPAGSDMSSFSPDFSAYDVVVSNYNGDMWGEATREAFEKYVGGGGGFVAVHAADNAFSDWHEYNRMIGLGGWGGRNEKHGPYVRWKEDLGKFTRDTSPGSGGTHGRRTPFLVVVRDSDHPITRGLPKSWMQNEDELYGKLRGPAENMHVLATAYSERETNGTGEHEPILLTIHYGNGRVFHTTLGHDVTAMQGLAFQVTLQRGTQWAATGEVTLPAVGSDVLTQDEPATRDPATITPVGDSAQVDFDKMPESTIGNWKSLFNGKDLTGWTQKNGTASYRVSDGAIVGKTASGSPNSFLCSDEEYADFELIFEVNCDPKLNSGVQVRSRSTAEFNNGRVHGPQVEIEGAPGESGYIYSEGTGRGWLSKTQPIKDAYKNDQWNRYALRASGDRIQTWVNGRKIEDLNDGESFKSGFIGLQVHSIKADEGPYEVRWRNIQVRPL